MDCIIADDSKIMRMLLSKIVENLGYRAIEAENGDELLQQYMSIQPDLIISDWELPLYDGVDILYKIRADKKIKQPIFMFCAYTKDTAIIEQALEAKADDFIMRPFDEDIIESKLKLAMLRRKEVENA
ncbi:MAG: response regulator [Alphaproteobacteria bacterium]|nr:response regulator [Alphaproteobacteria bacterium]